jgi:hypothetical protein
MKSSKKTSIELLVWICLMPVFLAGIGLATDKAYSIQAAIADLTSFSLQGLVATLLRVSALLYVAYPFWKTVSSIRNWLRSLDDAPAR